MTSSKFTNEFAVDLLREVPPGGEDEKMSTLIAHEKAPFNRMGGTAAG
jgi:hypothetical protein